MNSLSTNWLLWALILVVIVLAWAWLHSLRRGHAPDGYTQQSPTNLNPSGREGDANEKGNPARQKAQHSRHGCC